jgi:hypothetical protein
VPLARRDGASFPRKLLGDPSLSREEVLISSKGAVDGVPLARRDVASFPRKLLGDPLLSREGVLISPKGAIDCVPLSWEGRGIISQGSCWETRSS